MNTKNKLRNIYDPENYPIIFSVISVLLSIILFFRVEKYSTSDILLAAQHLKEKSDFNVMLFAVRPLLLLLAYLFPLEPLFLLSSLSLVSYLISVFLSYKFARELYERSSALLTTSLMASNFTVMLLSSAPMADLPGLASALAIQIMVFRAIRRYPPNHTLAWIKYGFFSGLLILVRENVMMAAVAMFLLLLFKKLYKALLVYMTSTLVVVICYQIYATLFLHMNYFTQLLTGISLSVKYSGAIYNPLKVMSYLSLGLTPILIFLLFLGFLFDDEEERFRILHLIALPSFALAILWPAIYEPRLAVIAFPGIIHICGKGLKELVGKLSKKPIYRLCGENLLTIFFLTLNLFINVLLAYINNNYSFSVIWRLLT